MPKNPIYKFLVDNGLTQKSETDFDKEYSDPNKAAELHKFFTENNLTTKDSASFYDSYFKPQKKKEVVPSVGAPVGSPPTSDGIKPLERVSFDPNKVRGYEDALKQFAGIGYENANKVTAQKAGTFMGRASMMTPTGGMMVMPESYPLLPEMAQKKSELQKQLKQYEQELNPLFDKAIQQNAGKFTTKDGQVDYGTIFKAAEGIAAKAGGGNYTKEIVAQKMVAAEQYKLIEPDVKKFADQEFKAKTGKTIEEFYKEKGTKAEAQAFQEKAYVETQFANEQKEAAQRLEQKSKDLFESEYKAALENAISEEEYNWLTNDYVSKLKNMQSEENSRLKRVGQEMYRSANQKIDAISKNVNLTSKEKAEIEAAYKKGYVSAVERKFAGEAAKQKALATLPMGKTILAGKALAEGFNLWLASAGAGMVGLGMNNGLTDWLRSKQETAERLKTVDIPLEGANWFDPNAYSTRLMKQLGMQGVPMAATLLTRSPAIGGTLGMASETIQVMGDTYNQVLQQTGNPAEAKNASKRVGMANTAMLPLYFMEADLLLKATKGGLFKSLATNVGQVPVELAQEFGQGYAQDAQINDRTFGEFVKAEGGELAKETAVLTVLQQGAFGGIGSVFNAIGENNKGVSTQYILDIARKEGVAKAGAIAEQLAIKGSLNEVELADTKELIANISGDIDAMREAGTPETQIQGYIANMAEADAIKKKEAELSATSPVRQQLASKRMQLEQDAKKMITGEGTTVTVTMPNGTQVVIPEANAAATIEGLAPQIGNGSVTVVAEGENAAVINEQVDAIQPQGILAEIKSKQELTESKIKRKDLFADGGVFANELGGSGVNSVPTNHRTVNDIEFVEFSNPNTGVVDVIMTGTTDNDYVGYYRLYENGKPTNKWSSKFENQSRNKENFKTMISGAQAMLPKNHEYTEKTSISTDGLRVWNQQLSRGYELQFDENGKLITNIVAINGDAIVNELGVDVSRGAFNNISVTNKEQFAAVKKALLPYLQKFGLSEQNIYWANGTVEIDLPVLKKTGQETTGKQQEASAPAPRRLAGRLARKPKEEAQPVVAEVAPEISATEAAQNPPEVAQEVVAAAPTVSETPEAGSDVVQDVDLTEYDKKVKPRGLPLNKMDKRDFENWVGGENVVNGKIKVYRGTNVVGAGLRKGDFVTTNKDYAKVYGKNVTEHEISVKELNYFSGVKGGDPNQLIGEGLSRKAQPTELIYSGKSMPSQAAPAKEDAPKAKDAEKNEPIAATPKVNQPTQLKEDKGVSGGMPINVKKDSRLSGLLSKVPVAQVIDGVNFHELRTTKEIAKILGTTTQEAYDYMMSLGEDVAYRAGYKQGKGMIPYDNAQAPRGESVFWELQSPIEKANFEQPKVQSKADKMLEGLSRETVGSKALGHSMTLEGEMNVPFIKSAELDNKGLYGGRHILNTVYETPMGELEVGYANDDMWGYVFRRPIKLNGKEIKIEDLLGEFTYNRDNDIAAQVGVRIYDLWVKEKNKNAKSAPTANQPTPKDKPKAATETKEGVAEAVQPSAKTVGGSNATGAAAVLNENNIPLQSKTTENEQGRTEKLPQQARNRAGRDTGGSLTPLKGAPTIQGATGPDPKIVAVAEKYAEENGIDLYRQSEYAEVDPEFSKRVADAYEAMKDDPQNPKVKEAYENLIKQTKAQYDALVKAGYEFSFFDSANDPYEGNPYNAIRDLRENKKMAVYGTYDGYGTEGITASAIANSPMLADTGLRWKDQNGVERMVTANDLFRAVHDAFGHSMEGSGFRARGEENAWQAHVRLFTGSAVAAITTETRGQNSWLNFGTYGESNRTAKLEDTVFAEQKTGLMPEWTWTENRVGDMPKTETKKSTVTVTPKNGELISYPTRDGKSFINYFWKDGKWNFIDSRGRTVKETEGKQAEITEYWQRVSGKLLEKSFTNSEGDTVQVGKFIERAQAILKALFPDASFVVYESSYDYQQATGDMFGRGSYDPATKTVALNLEKMKRDGAAKTEIHEVIHPIVREAISSDENALAILWERVAELKDVAGMEKVWQHVLNYNESQQAEEGVTEFITRVVDGTIDLSKVPESISTKIIDIINKIFEALGLPVVIGTQTDLGRLSKAVKIAFETGDISGIQKALGRPVKKLAMPTVILREMGDRTLEQLAPEFEQDIADILEEFPDATLQEIMEEVTDSRPELVATPELRAETEKRVAAILSPTLTPLQKAIKGMQAAGAKGKKFVAKTKQELAKVMESVFGLNEEKADAAAEIAHLMIVNEAKLNGISVAEQYQRYAFAQAEPKQDLRSALFQILGEKGAAALDAAEEATTRLDNLKVAKDMEAAKKPAKAILLATGWQRGADGKWRYEVGDGKLKKGVKSGVYKINDIYEGEILNAYPEIGEVPIEIEIEFGRNLGVFGEGSLTTTIDGDYFKIHIDAATKSKLHSILEHELMHIIQFKEGFARGGSYNDVGNKKSFFGQAFDFKSYFKYRKIAGEVESNNVMSRMKFTPEQRRQTLLEETEDVSRKDQIFLEQGLEQGAQAMSQAATDPNTGNILYQGGEDAVDNAVKALDDKLKRVGALVDGREVREKVPNMSSIESSLDDYEILGGIREVPFTEFPTMGELSYYDRSEAQRTKALAEQIKESGEINPLIVVYDAEGAYILEGAHRFDALRELGAKSFPAKVVIDAESIAKSAAQPQGGNILYQAEAEKKISVNGKELTVKPLPEGLAVVNGFYSPIEKRILEFKQPTASATKWKEIVGTKEEAKFTGVAEWLDTKKPNEQVSKAEVLAWMRDNRIEVVEVVKEQKNTFDEASKRHDELVRRENDGSITDEELEELDVLENLVNKGESEDNTKFSQYQLEGDKTNYREVLVTLPPTGEANITKLNRYVKEIETKYRLHFGAARGFMTDAEMKTYKDLYKATEEKYDNAKFKSSHFSEPNILVHLRMNTRQAADGSKVLFLEEVQSDWGQIGKKEGFDIEQQKIQKEAEKEVRDGLASGEYKVSKHFDRNAGQNGMDVYVVLKGETAISKGYNENSAINSAINLVADKKGVKTTSVPTAPFVTDTNAWTKLGLKIAAQQAVKEGASRLSWTTGEQQNDRYDLSKQVDRIVVEKRKGFDDVYRVRVFKDGSQIEDKDYLKQKDVADMVGKEIADKAAQGQTEFVGKDLRVGGKGMIGFYGSPTEGTLGIVGKVAESLFKQTPKTVEIDKGEDYKTFTKYQIVRYENHPKEWAVIKNGNILERFKTHDEAQAFKTDAIIKERAEGNKSTQHSIDITPDIIAEVTQGMPLFQNKGLGAQGAIVMQAANRVVYAMTNPNVTTPLHEMAHGYFDTLISAGENGNAQAAADVKVFAEQAGVSAADLRTDEAGYTKAQELFARGFERYLRDGKAPTPELQSLFDKFKNWLLEIYKSLSESPIDVPLNDAMRAVYGRMLTPEQVKQDFPPKPPVSNPVTQEEKDDITGITHADTEKDRIEAGLPPYDKKTKTDDDLEAEANALIESGWNFEKNIDKVLNDGKILSDAEQEALGKYKIYLRDKANAAPTNANINAYERVLKALEFSGTLSGRALRARKLPINPEPTLADFLVRQKEESGVDELTPAQFEQNKKEFEALQKASQEWEAKFKALEAEAIAKAAEENLSSKKKNKPKTPRTKENIRKERDEILQRMKDRIKKAKEGKTFEVDGEQVSIQQADIVPFMRELIAIAPEVPALVSNYIEEGIFELSEIAKRLKTDLENEVPGITEEDAIALIAGEYKTGNKKTRNEIQKLLYDLRAEAKLIGQLQALENGEVPKDESKKVERNRKLTELRKQIKAHPNNQLPEYKKQVQRNIDKLQRDLDSGNFAAPPKKLTVTLDKEARELKRKLVDLKTEREVRLLREAYEKMGIGQKVGEKLLKVANIPRTLMASMDFSAPLRQAVIATIGNPTLAFKGFGSMFKAAFNKGYMDEWFFDLENDPNYEIMKESGLSIADPNSPFLRAREEAFMSGYVEKVEGFIGEKLFGNKNFGFVQGSERAYVMYLNKMRVDLFNKYAAALEQKGKTYDNSPDTYKAIAKYVNNVTGRGNMGKAEEIAKFSNALFFSPRLIASRLSLMNPYYIYKMPSDVRKIYVKDMAAFIATGLTVIGMIYLAGGGDEEDDIWVETDPRSSDFMKIRQGEKRWDIWGGFQQYIRTIIQYFSGEKKSPTTDEITELKEDAPYGETRGKLLTRFVRNKLAPIPSSIWDLTSGRNSVGEKVTFKDEIISSVTPLLWQQVYEVAKAEGAVAAITIGVPSVFGVGTERYGERAIEAPDKIKVGAKEYKLSKEMQEKLQVMIEAETKVITDKAKKMSEYESGTKKQKVELISMAKLLARKEATKDFQTKYKNEYPAETPIEIRARLDEEAKKKDLNKSVKKLMK